jgi:hypothetical protein
MNKGEKQIIRVSHFGFDKECVQLVAGTRVGVCWIKESRGIKIII